MKRIEVFNNYDNDICVPLAEMISFLQKAYDQVPDEFKDKALFSAESDHDTSYIDMKAYFDRPLTPLETAEKERKELEYKARVNAERHAEYLRLKAIFEKV